MDYAEPLSLDDLPGLVLGERTALASCPGDQGFPPRIDKSGLRVVDEKAQEILDRISILLTSSPQQDHSWLFCVAPLSSH